MSAIAYLRKVEEHCAATLPRRGANTGHQYGGIEFTSIGAREDDPRLDAVPVNRAVDYDLVRALALRGYDVRARQPKEKDLARAKLRSERIAAAWAVGAFLEWGCL